MKVHIVSIILVHLLSLALARHSSLADDHHPESRILISRAPAVRTFTPRERDLLRGAVGQVVYTMQTHPARRLVLFTGGAIAYVYSRPLTTDHTGIHTHQLNQFSYFFNVLTGEEMTAHNIEIVPISGLGGGGYGPITFTESEVAGYSENVLRHVVARQAPFEEVVLVDIVNSGLSLTRTVTLLKACAAHLNRADLFKDFKYIAIQSEGAAPPPYIGEGLQRLGEPIYLDETLYDDIDEGEFPRLMVKYLRDDFGKWLESLKQAESEEDRAAQQAVLMSLRFSCGRDSKFI